MTSGQGDRSKDGVPTWDGSASTYQAYEEQVLMWDKASSSRIAIFADRDLLEN